MFLSRWEQRLYEIRFVWMQKDVGEKRGTIRTHWNADCLLEDFSLWKPLMKNSEFCEDMSKSKTANHVTFIIYLWRKWRIFPTFWVELCKTLERDGQKIKISTSMKNFYFWVKYTVFIKNEKEVLKNSDFCYTWSNDHI